MAGNSVGRELLFIEAYCGAANFNASKAYVLAGYKAGRHAPRAARLLKSPRVAAAVAARVGQRIKDLQAIDTAHKRSGGGQVMELHGSSRRARDMNAVAKIHRNDKGVLAISTNAANEADFLRAIAVPLALTSDVAALETLLSQVVDICCRIRGYKSNVAEHRILVAGEWLPEDVVEAFSTGTTTASGMPLPTAKEMRAQALS